MATEIQYTNDVTGALERMQGSNGRANVSSRSDTRAYYNSRDEKQTYSIAYDFQSAAAGEYGVYLKNDSTTNQDIVISAITASTVQASRIKLWSVTGTAAGGTSLTPSNLNLASGNTATATAMEGGSAATGITGLTAGSLLAFGYVAATTQGSLDVKDTLRLGPNDAIALEYDEGTDGDMSGTILFYFETAQ